MAEPTLYLFDGYNVLRAAGLEDRRELVDLLAGYVALRGAQGVVVFDGVGEEAAYGALEVRFASPADHLIERLAAESRDLERVCVVSSDRALLTAVGHRVRRRSSKSFLRDLRAAAAPRAGPDRFPIEDALDEDTRRTLERWRRRRR